MSNLRNGYVACPCRSPCLLLMLRNVHVQVTIILSLVGLSCRLEITRTLSLSLSPQNGHVAVSILVVQTHCTTFLCELIGLLPDKTTFLVTLTPIGRNFSRGGGRVVLNATFIKGSFLHFPNTLNRKCIPFSPHKGGGGGRGVGGADDPPTPLSYVLV